MSDVVVSRASAPKTCPYCKGAVAGHDLGCACGVVYHADCRAGLERCVTIGCNEPTRIAPLPFSRPPTFSVVRPQPRPQTDMTLADVLTIVGRIVGPILFAVVAVAVVILVPRGWDRLAGLVALVIGICLFGDAGDLFRARRWR